MDRERGKSKMRKTKRGKEEKASSHTEDKRHTETPIPHSSREQLIQMLAYLRALDQLLATKNN